MYENLEWIKAHKYEPNSHISYDVKLDEYY